MSIPDHEIDEDWLDNVGLCMVHDDYLPCIHCANDEADRRGDETRESNP